MDEERFLSIFPVHTASVIGDPYKRDASAGEFYLDMSGTAVDGIIHQFLND